MSRPELQKSLWMHLCGKSPSDKKKEMLEHQSSPSEPGVLGKTSLRPDGNGGLISPALSPIAENYPSAHLLPREDDAHFFADLPDTRTNDLADFDQSGMHEITKNLSSHMSAKEFDASLEKPSDYLGKLENGNR